MLPFLRTDLKRHLTPRMWGRALICGALLMLSLSLSAQDEGQDAPHMAFVHNGDIFALNLDTRQASFLADGQPFAWFDPSTPGSTYHQPILLPGQAGVLFKSWTEDRVWRVPLESDHQPALWTDLTVFQPFPITWVSDQQAFTVGSWEHGLALYSLSLDGEAHRLFPLDSFATGCGGGPFTLDDNLYYMQAGFMGNGLMLEQMDENTLLLSSACSGEGLQRLDLTTGNTTLFHPRLRRAHLSKDRTQVAGLDGEQFVVLDAKTGREIFRHESSSGYDQLVWLPDGTLVFTTVVVRDQMALTPVDNLVAEEMFFHRTPETVPLYTVSLYRWNMAAEATQYLWSTNEWRGIPVLSAEDNLLIFSAVRDLSALVTALNEGRDPALVQEAIPYSSIYALDYTTPKSGPELLIREGEEPSFIHVGS